MRILTMILRFRFYRMPLRVHFRLSLSMADVKAKRIEQRPPTILSRFRWTLVLTRAPPR